MQVRKLFEEELASRGLAWEIDAASGRHLLQRNGGRMLVSLENLERDVASSGDVQKVAHFVDAILAAANPQAATLSADQLYWTLEPSDQEAISTYRAPVSRGADRVLAHLSADGKHVTWVTADMLRSLNLSAEEAEAIAFDNLATALTEAALDTSDVDGVVLGFLATALPFKSSLILAPNAKAVLAGTLGWPLLAVAPDRDFLYLWAARHSDFASRVGPVVTREYAQAPYPISTELFELSDQGARAIGAFAAGT